MMKKFEVTSVVAVAVAVAVVAAAVESSSYGT